MTSQCIIWAGRLDRDGYGRDKGKLAHRIAYEGAKGPIPDGLTIDHLCRNRACVNPEHLEAVTHCENVLRGFNPCAINARKTHCVNGHPFDESNTHTLLVNRTNERRERRVCRACNLASVKAYQSRNGRTA